MLKLANILGVNDETDLHKIVDKHVKYFYILVTYKKNN